MEAGLGLAERRFGANLRAAFAIGSLAHGGFSPEASDVDLALILGGLSPRTESEMTAIRESIQGAFPDVPLARRLSLFWSTWESLAERRPMGRFPLLDRLDLVESGLLLRGKDRRDGVSIPRGEALQRELVVETAAFILEKLASPAWISLLRDPGELASRGCREVTKAVLLPVRFLYTVDTGGLAGNPRAIRHYIEKRAAAAGGLVALAGAWREGMTPPSDILGAELASGLAALYRELVAAYEPRLRELGHAAWAERIRAWGQALGVQDRIGPA